MEKVCKRKGNLDPLSRQTYHPNMIRTVTGRIPGRPKPQVGGSVSIPASKSHTVRALLFAAFAQGDSRLRRPLESRDARSCRTAIEVLGARVRDEDGDWIVTGIGSIPKPIRKTIHVGNSGTTLYLATALAALAEAPISFDGDDQIRKRSAQPLLDALKNWGADISNENHGCAPYTIQGPLSGGSVSVECPVSQYLSALLMTAPLVATDESQIIVTSLNEAPYVGITLDWLKDQNIVFQQNGWNRFVIPGRQSYRPFDRVVPADWSSATFFLAAAAVTGSALEILGVDPQDSQGDKAVMGMLTKMGCQVESIPGGIRIEGKPLRGAVLDLNATPDALPAMAVVACFAEGETRLENVPQARMKECDRIAVMTKELLNLGADVQELTDGMVIRGRLPADGATACEKPVLKGALADGHDDHRVVMALAVAALGCCGEISIKGAEAADVTFPGFFTLLDKALEKGSKL